MKRYQENKADPAARNAPIRKNKAACIERGTALNPHTKRRVRSPYRRNKMLKGIVKKVLMAKKSKIEYLNVVTTLDLNPDNVLESAKGELEKVVVLGWDKEGEPYFKASMADGGDCLWLL